MSNPSTSRFTTTAVLLFGTIGIGLSHWSVQVAPAAPPADVKDRGVFIITVAGKQIGTETFEIKTQKSQVSAEASVELQVEQQGKTLTFTSSAKLVLTSDLRALAYQWNQTGAQSSRLEVDLRATPVVARYHTVSGEDDTRQFELPRDVIILDNNVIHHYQLAVQCFRGAGGGRQSFRAFIPQQALPGSLNIEDVGPEPVDVGGRQQRLDHLTLTTDNARIELWVDGRGRVQKISIPAAQLDVIRKR